MVESAKPDGRLVFDCLSAVLLLAVAVLGAYMPKYLASRGSLQQGTASSLAFHLGNMLSGGVMLSAGFCHLLADALRQLAFLGRFPIAPFLAACGYLITLLADQVVQLLTTDADEPQHGISQLPSPNPGFGSPGLLNPGMGPTTAGFSRPGPGFSRPASAQPLSSSSSRTPPPPGGSSAFGNFLRSGLGHKTWGYSRLEEEAVPLQQQHQQQQHDSSGSGCHGGGAIELITAAADGARGLGNYPGSIAAAAAPPAGLVGGHGGQHCNGTAPGSIHHADSSSSSTMASQQQQQQQQRGCCHNPASCPCCLSHADAAGEGVACDAAAHSCSCTSAAGTAAAAAAAAAAYPAPPPGSHYCHPGRAAANGEATIAHQTGGGGAGGVLGGNANAGPGYPRRPGSAGGLARAGLGLGSVARTRSLTSPSAAGAAALPPLLAAAAAEAGVLVPSAAAAAPGGSTTPGTTAAAGVPAGQLLLGGQQQQQQVPSPVLVSTAAAAAGGSAGGDDDALCVLAAGSPRSVSAYGLRPRSPSVKAAATAAAASAGLIHQQQQQQQHQALSNHQQQHSSQPELQLPLPMQQQQQQLQLQLTSPALPQQQQQQQEPPQRSSSSIAQMLMQPVRQLSLPAGGGGCCCCAGGVCRSSGLPSAQPDMTEACTVARVAGHLELEVMSTVTGGGHNHAHFQVFLSQRPLSFATSLLLACALCIHSILEGLALGAQQSMQATEDIMLAIAAHKGLAAYALGASIVESGASDSKFWVVVGLFAAATPLGIAIGYASSVLGHGPVSAAMSALASGTFLYVALNEVIPKELEHPDGHRLAKVAALLLGFGLMSLLAVWA